MIGQQAAGPDLGFREFRKLGKQIDIVEVVVGTEESFLSTIAALRNVMGKRRDYDSRHPGHRLPPCKYPGRSIISVESYSVYCPPNPVQSAQFPFGSPLSAVLTFGEPYK